MPDTTSLTEREAALLLGLVTEYIRTGQPVGSVALARVLALQKSPATIRAGLHELEEAGYVFQPHTSAGRVPTDKGYRYYVDHLQEHHVARTEHEHLQEQFRELLQAHQQLTRITARFLARLTATAALSSKHDPPDVYESGLRELVQHTDTTSGDALREVTNLLDKLDEQLSEEPLPTSSENPQVYIGAEIPFMSAQHSSMVVRDVALPYGQSMTLIILGPKRMPYHRNIALLNAVATIIKQYDPLE